MASGAGACEGTVSLAGFGYIDERSPVSGGNPGGFPGVAVVIPARDEAETICRVLTGLKRYDVGQVVVGDNGSRDGTGVLAGRAGADVVHEDRLGYGAACAAALTALTPDISVVAFLDADLADDSSRLPELLGPILADEADLVIGVRPVALRESGSMTPPQAFGNWLATRLIRWIWGHAYQDLGPFRAIRRSSLEELGMEDRRFGWTVEMQVRALQEGLRVREVPVAYRARNGGRSKISGTVAGVFRAGASILHTIGRLWWSERVGRTRSLF